MQSRKKNLPTLKQDEITLCQQITGTLLYYAIAVDPTMLVALGTLQQPKPKPPNQPGKTLIGYWTMQLPTQMPKLLTEPVT